MLRLNHLLGSIRHQYIFTSLLILVLISTSASETLKERFSDEALKKAESLQSFKSIGIINIGGTVGTFEILYSKPGLSRTTLALGDFELIQVYDGQRAWMKDQNGQVIELTGPDKKQLVNTGWLLGKSYLQKKAIPGEIKFFKDTIINSNNYSIYSALPQGGDSLKLYFNTKTNRIEIIGESLDEINIFTFMSDFRDIEGFEMAFGHESKSIIPELNSTLEIQEITVNQQIEDSLFTLSIVSPDDYYFPPNTDSIVIPIVYHTGHIFIKVSINGNSNVYFILDSGAGINFLSRSYANILKLEQSDGIPSKGMAGYESTAITKLDSLKIGDIAMYDQNVAIVDLSGIGINIPDGIFGGLLGFDVLSRFPIRIDYQNKEIVFYNPATFHSGPTEYALSIEFNMKVPIVNAEICGVSGKFLVDLGNSLGLILHKPFINSNNLNDKFADINKTTNGLAGVGGSSDTYSTIAEYFSFGPAYLKNIKVLVAEGKHGIIKSTDVDGNIGNALLQNFSILFGL